MRILLGTVLCIALAGTIFSGCGKSADELLIDANAQILKKETDEAIANLNKFLNKYPKDSRRPEVYFILGQAYHTKKDFQSSVEALEKIIIEFPDSRDAEKSLFMIAYIYAENIPNYTEAERAFRKFIAKYPDSEMAPSAEKMLENLGKPIEQWDIFTEEKKQ